MLPPCSVVGHRAAGPHCSEVKSEPKADGTFTISNFLVVTFLKLADELKFYIMYFILFKIVSFLALGCSCRGAAQLGVCLPTMQGALRPIPSITREPACAPSPGEVQWRISSEAFLMR